MKNIIILGSSIAGVKVAQTIRAKDKESSIKIFALEGTVPFKRSSFISFLSNEIKEKEMQYCDGKDLAGDDIELVLSQTITRINLNRKKIHTQEKQQYSYDVLIIAGAQSSKFADIKGNRKEGLYAFDSLKDCLVINQRIPLVNSVVIESDSWVGVDLCAAISRRGREVILVSEKNVLTESINQPEVLGWFLGQLREKGIQIIRENKIEEILGDSELKAIRLKTGKIFGCDMVIFEDTKPDLRLLSDSPLRWIEGRIVVDENHQTSVNDVYALDQTCCLSDGSVDTASRWSSKSLENQGEYLANLILAQESSESSDQHQVSEEKNDKICSNSSEIECKTVDFAGITINFLGQTKQRLNIRDHWYFEETAGSYQRILIEEDHVVGAVLINASLQLEKIEKIIKDLTKVAGHEDRITDSSVSYAQFKDILSQESDSPIESQPLCSSSDEDIFSGFE